MAGSGQGRLRIGGWMALLTAAAVAGCGKAVVIEQEFPQPLVRALPLSVGIYYDEELVSFSFLDTTIDGATWSVDLGSSNIKLFDQIFSAMFRDTVRLESVASGADDEALDAIISPVIQEFGFLAPSESGSNFWAVSIEYRMELYDGDGKQLTTWPVIAYGKSRSRALKGDESLAEATNYALRDAAAALAVELPKRRELLNLIQSAGATEPGTRDNTDQRAEQAQAGTHDEDNTDI